MKLDIGCGKTIKEGFEGLDKIEFGQKYICDVRNGLPFEDNSIDEIYSRHFLIYLTNFGEKFERVKFFNELYRVMKQDATASIFVPTWNSSSYGNPEFQEPLYEGSLFYLRKKWREENSKETTIYTCDFDATWGYNLHPSVATRNMEYQQFAVSNYCNATVDVIINLKKVKI
jgi:SAM-dependent methyltransferase